jgi:hypothetical protein
MSRVNPVKELLHNIRVKLYPNNLPGARVKYIARTNPETVLDIRQVSAFSVNRGGFKGGFEAMVEYVTAWFEEAMYQLLNGFAIDMGFFSIHPTIGGAFYSDKDPYDPKRNPISFTFRIKGRLRSLIRHITVEVVEVADTAGRIDELLDVEEKAINTFYVPGDQFVLSGHKFKVDGKNPVCGLFFVPVDDPSKEVRVDHFAVNLPTKIVGRVPRTGFPNNRLEIRTQFSGGGNLLKDPVVLTLDSILEEIEK